MSDFQTALERSLTSVTEAFASADADLHQEVASASKAVSSLTQGKATLELAPLSEDENWIVYKLTLKAGDRIQARLADFTVPTKGYPIQSGPQQFKNRQELAALLASMAANPDSPLVRHLALFLRWGKRSGGQSDETDLPAR
jgi:hypothetical protein